MAIIRTNKYPLQYPSITEDPTPNSNLLYFQLDGHNKTTLTPLIDSMLNLNPASYLPVTFGISQQAGEITGPLGGILQLKGEVTHCRHVIYNTQSDYRNNIDYAPFLSMDPTRPIIQTRSDTYNTLTHNIIGYNYYPNSASVNYYFTRKVGNTQDYSQTPPLQNTTLTATYYAYPMYINPSTGNQIVIAGLHSTTPPGTSQGASWTGIFGSTLAQATPVTGVQGTKNMQFVGVATDNLPIFLHNNVGDDYTQVFYKYNDSNNTSVVLNTFNTAPAGAGTSAGGARTAPTGGNFCVKLASRTFTNPNTNNTGFYLPYFDTSGNYHPHYFEWNTTTNVFTRNSAITMTYASGNFSTYHTVDVTSLTSVSIAYGMQRFYANESFVYSGTRYVTFMYLHGAGGVLDATPLNRTFVTYSVNGSNYAQLTYHSSLTIPATPKSIVWLNDARTLFGIFTQANFYIYSFNSAVTGWALTASLPYQFNAVGRDSLGRIWAQDSGPFGYGRVHLLSGAVPTTVSVVPAQTSYSYAGSTINTTLIVNAYDATGARMVANITLTATGNGIRLVDGSSNQVTTLVVTTSASANTTVNAAVISAGPTTISSSIVF
jgi:hypothetical protein